MKKELTISAKFDTSDFDKSVDRMQNRLKDLYAPADQVRSQTQMAQKMNQMGINVQGPSQEAYQRNMQRSRKELDSSLKEEYQNQEKLSKLIIKREEKLKSLKDQQKELVRGSKEELEIVEKIGRVKENISKQNEFYKQRESVLNQTLSARQSISPNGMPGLLEAFKSGGLKYGMSQVPGAFKANPMGMGASIAGGLGAAAGMVGGAGAAAEQFTGYGMRLEGARGSAVSGTAGKDLANIYGGRSPFEAAWMPERTEAAGLAAQKAGRNRVTDRMKGIGSIGGMVAGGALMAGGAVVGAASLAGTPFTAGGSALGLPVAGGMMASGAAMFGGGVGGLSNDRSRKGILGGKEYDQLLAGQQAQDKEQALQNLMDQDPGKKLSMDKFESERRANVGTQRTLGLSNQGFYGEGGFQQRGAKAGFMNDQMAGMAGQIVGAGGSARMGQQSDFGLKMERSGLTNAGSILGSMSGSIQSPESTKRATISIMAEAFKIGLDDTDFAEENRKFTQAAANIIGKSGATTEGDQDKLTQALGQFLGERTNRGVEAAGTAYEKSQERGSQLGGRRGAMRMMSARQDPNLSKLDQGELAELLGMRPDQIREDSAAARTFAADAGFTGKDAVGQLKQALKKGTDSARLLIPSNRNKMADKKSVVQKYMQDKGLTYSQLREQSRAGKLPADVDNALGRMDILGNQEEGTGLNVSDSEAATGEFLSGNVMTNTADKDAAKGRLENKNGRVEDTFNTKAAEGADAARENFMKLLPALQAIGAAADELTSQLAPAATALHNTATARQATQPKGNAYGSDIFGPILQPQANKPKGQ